MTEDTPDARKQLSQLDRHDMIGSAKLAELLDVSKRTISRWIRAGRIPQPAKPGHELRWRAGEIRAWIDAGCPRASDWLKVRAI